MDKYFEHNDMDFSTIISCEIFVMISCDAKYETLPRYFEIYTACYFLKKILQNVRTLSISFDFLLVKCFLCNVNVTVTFHRIKYIIPIFQIHCE